MLGLKRSFEREKTLAIIKHTFTHIYRKNCGTYVPKVKVSEPLNLNDKYNKSV